MLKIRVWGSRLDSSGSG